MKQTFGTQGRLKICPIASADVPFDKLCVFAYVTVFQDAGMR
jgi:hypothetical protein